jgi:hypothetical protein
MSDRFTHPANRLSVSLFPLEPPSPSLSTGESLPVQGESFPQSLLRRLRLLKCNCRHITNVVDAGQPGSGLQSDT